MQRCTDLSNANERKLEIWDAHRWKYFYYPFLPVRSLVLIVVLADVVEFEDVRLSCELSVELRFVALVVGIRCVGAGDGD